MLKIIHINNYSKSTVSKLVIISNNCNFSQKSNLDEKQTEHKHNVIKNSGKEPAKVPSANSSEWRSPVHKEDASQNRMLNMFNSDQNSIKFLKWLQQPIDLRPATIKKWWLRISDEAEEEMQRYNPNRHQALGPELACAHFIVYRGGAIKFHNNDKWIKAVDKEYTLPLKYSTGLFLQSIDCTGMNLRYEGLSNLRGLQNVQWLSLNGCKYMDDFCMDVISNIFSHSLVYLDLRNCWNISERGLGALYKMKRLRTLYLDDIMKDTKFEYTCMLLQDLFPNLEIKSDVIDFEIKRD